MPAGIDPTGGYLTAASDVLSSVEGGIELFSNLAKEKKDKAALASLHPAFYKIQDEYYQNRNLTSNLAQGGLPSSTKDYLTGETQRGLSAGISGTLQSGSADPNAIAKLFSGYNNNAIDKTAAEDADQKIKNIQYFMKANSDLAGQKTTQWALNEYQPTQEKKKQLNENIAAEQKNVAAGANQLLGSVGATGTSLSNNSLLNNRYKKTSPSPTNTDNTRIGEDGSSIASSNNLGTTTSPQAGNTSPQVDDSIDWANVFNY
jgi:hypothetical protein